MNSLNHESRELYPSGRIRQFISLLVAFILSLNVSQAIALECNGQYVIPITFSNWGVAPAIGGDFQLNPNSTGTYGKYYWLQWSAAETEEQKRADFFESLPYPGNLTKYQNPNNPTDTNLNPFDWVRIKSGVTIDDELKLAVSSLVGKRVVIPYKNVSQTVNGEEITQIGGFREVEFLDFRFNDYTKRMYLRYWGEVDCDAPPNVAPVANTGNYLVVNEQTTVNLNGSNSTDLDGSITAYNWVQLSGTAVALQNSTSPTPTFAAPAVTSTQTLVFQLTVTDNDGATSTDAVVVTVNPVNIPPNVNQGVTLECNGLNVIPITFKNWSVAPAIGGDFQLNPNWTGTYGKYYWLQWSAAATEEQKRADFIESLPYPGTLAKYQNPNNATDTNLNPFDWARVKSDVPLDGDLRVAVSSLVGKRVVIPYKIVSQTVNGEEITQIGGFREVEFLDFRFNDWTKRMYLRYWGEVNCDTAPNVAPVANAGIDLSVNAQTTVNLDGSNSTDNDGSITAYNWIQLSGTEVALQNSTSPTPTFTAPAVTSPQTLVFQLTVTDNDGASSTDAVVVTVNPAEELPAPTAQDSTITTNENQAITFPLNATFAVGSFPVFQLVQNPAHGSVVLGGNLWEGITATYTPNANYSGLDTFTFKLVDGIRESNVATVSITVHENNEVPVALSQELTMQEDTALAVTLSASNVDTSSLVYQINAQPEHGTLVGSPPNLTYVPEPDYYGNDAFSFFVIDGQSNIRSNTAAVTITVDPVNDAPEIVSTPTGLTIIRGNSFSYPVIAEDQDGDALTYSVASSLEGVSVSTAGVVTLNTSTVNVGTYPVSVTVTDTANASVSQSFSLNVISSATSALQITSTPPIVASARTGYSYPVTTNYSASQVSYELVDAPAGAAFNTNRVVWSGKDQNRVELNQKVTSCANLDEFVIGSYGSSSLFVESLHRPDRFPKLYKSISPTLADTTNLDNQISLSVQTRTLAGSQWGFSRWFGFTWVPPEASGYLTRLIVDGPDGRDLGFSNGNGDYERPFYDGQEQRGLAIHTDVWARRASHNNCETTNNFGVISGVAQGNWELCRVANWGRYGVITAMPQAEYWRSDLTIVSANVTAAQTVNFELRNRGLVAAGAFNVNVYESIDGLYQLIGTVPVTGLGNLAAQTFSVNAGRPILGDVRISIDYPSAEAFECDTDNNSVDLSYFKVKATGNNGVTAYQNFWVSTRNDQLEVLNDLPQAVYDNAAYIYRPEVFGGSGAYSYSLVSGPSGTSISSAGELRWQPTRDDVGMHSFTVRVSDVTGASVEKQGDVEVLEYPHNAKPAVLSTPPTDAVVGQQYVYQLEIADPDGDAFTIVKSSGQLDANYRLTWTPTRDLYDWALSRGGYTAMVVEIMDSEGAVTIHNWGVNLHLSGANTSLYPQIAPMQSAYAVAGGIYTASVSATNPLSDTLIYSLTQSPEGMTISSTGVISWTPEVAQTGEHEIVVRASNTEGYDEVSFIIQVNGPLQITSQPAQVAYDSHPYVYVVTTSVPAQRYILSVAPEGMTINTSGQINWTPDSGDMGTHNVLIRAEDSLGNWASQSFVLSVLGNNASTNQPPQFLSTPSTRTVADQLYYYQAQAVDPNGLAVTYSLTTGPAGMTLSSTGDLHWTPTLSQVGAHPVSMEASDGMIRTTQSYSLLVASTSAPNSPPQLTGSPIQHFETGKLTTDQVSVTDADGDSLSYVLTTAPAGMTIDGSGKISWQPTLQQLGQHSVALRVEDGFGGIATRSYSVNVTEPVIQNASFLSLINEPKTEAFVGTNYRFRTAGFSTRGGSVAVALVAVPSGMTIRANTPVAGYYELNWTPDEANCQRDVTLELRDSLGNTRQITYTIDVYNAPKRLGRFQCSADAEFCATR